ncbi:hypothetical protein TIFTF001_006102 [Ficus carica]|uniref:Uncharacterized protein n=1 Tax=Ficus carica TaxID=3494 RepID=A0AA87ZZS7_FICCA|nr:hypothetical protein TIFTF001_006102 [Ficus carica]
MSDLVSLSLDRNQLNGSVPPELGKLALLQALYLSENQLSGSIPPELGNLTSLIVLDLSENQLSGPLPRELGKLTSLEYLYLYENQLNDALPSDAYYCNPMISMIRGKQCAENDEFDRLLVEPPSQQSERAPIALVLQLRPLMREREVVVEDRSGETVQSRRAVLSPNRHESGKISLESQRNRIGHGLAKSGIVGLVGDRRRRRHQLAEIVEPMYLGRHRWVISGRVTRQACGSGWFSLPTRIYCQTRLIVQSRILPSSCARMTTMRPSPQSLGNTTFPQNLLQFPDTCKEDMDTWHLSRVLRNYIPRFLVWPMALFKFWTGGGNIMDLSFLGLSTSSGQPDSTG